MSSQPSEGVDRAGAGELIGRSLRYVVLHHEGIATPHFDLLFEWDAGAALTSFRCPAWPPAVGDAWDEAAEHRRLYLKFEGELTDGRGRVRRVAWGELDRDVLATDPPTLALGDADYFAIVVSQRIERGLTAWTVEAIAP